MGGSYGGGAMPGGASDRASCGGALRRCGAPCSRRQAEPCAVTTAAFAERASGKRTRETDENDADLLKDERNQANAPQADRRSCP